MALAITGKVYKGKAWLEAILILVLNFITAELWLRATVIANFRLGIVGGYLSEQRYLFFFYLKKKIFKNSGVDDKNIKKVTEIVMDQNGRGFNETDPDLMINIDAIPKTLGSMNKARESFRNEAKIHEHEKIGSDDEIH